MKKSLILLMLLTLVMAPMMTACGSSSKDDASASQGGTVQSEDDSKTPIEYTINVIDPKSKWDTPIGNAYTEATGVSFDYVPVIGDVNQKYEIWAASGDYTDVLMLTPYYLQRFKDNGNIIPLENLIDQYGPNIKKKLGKYYDLLKDDDGHIYSLYGIRQAVETPATSQANFGIQYDVLADAGYPEIKTLDDLFNVLKAYYEKHPTIDGAKTIPWSGLSLQMITNNPSMSAYGIPDHGAYYMDEENNVHLSYTSEFTKEYLKFLNKLYKADMLDPELFSLNQETGSAKIAQGRVLAGYFPQWMLNGPEQTLLASNKQERMYAKFPVLLNSSVEDHSNAFALPSSSNYWSITDKAKNPERIIQFIDYLFTDEGQKLMNWGVEGMHYDVIDGERVRKQEVIDGPLEDPDYGSNQGFNGPFIVFSAGDGAKLDDGDYATPITRDYALKSLDNKSREVLQHYNKELWVDFLPQPEIIPAFLWQIPRPEYVQDVMYIFDDIQPIINKELPRVIMANSDDEFNQAWDKLVKAVDKKGAKELEAAYSKLWKDYSAKFDDLNS